MRKVKFLLDWKDSRETEFRLAKLRNATEEKGRFIAPTERFVSKPVENLEALKKEMAEELKVVSSHLESCV
jgi:hypothetical protein